MYSFKHAAFDLTPYQQLSNELSWMVKGTMPRLPEFGVPFTLTPSGDAIKNPFNSPTLAMLDSVHLETNLANGLNTLSNSLSLWTKSETEALFKSTQIMVNALADSLQASCSPALGALNLIAQLSEQWDTIKAGTLSKDSCEEAFLDENVSEAVTDILVKSSPESCIERESILAKLKSKMSVGDLIGLIGILVSMLLFIYGQISSAKDQKIIEQQNQTIIAEEREIEKDIEEKEQYKQTILLTARQLTDTAQRLESSLPPKESKHDQQEQDIDQGNGNSQPKD